MKLKKPISLYPRNGFALVVTLALMVLLSLLAVGLLGLSSVELRSAGRESEMKKAQANARLALHAALGELQKELGPDQRVTAPGGQKLQAGSALPGKHWVGVYDSWDAAAANRPATPVFRKWLISGEESTVADQDAATTAGPLANRTATLVKGNAASTQAEANDPVEAGLIEVPSGAYAWWVGDNSMKAKLGNSLRAAPAAQEVLAALQSAPRTNPHPILVSNLPASDPGWNTLVTLQTADLIGTSSTALFHDATTLSNGLMTNVRAGGLRKDLSFLMEKSSSQISGAPLYTAGLSLQQLWAAHQIWGERQTSGLPTHADGTNLPVGTPYLTPPDTPAAAAVDPFLQYRQITQVRSLMLFSFISQIDPATGNYNLFLIVDPVFTLWNPFDVTVYIPPGAFTSFKNWSIPYRIDITAKIPDGAAFNTKNVSVDLHDLFGGGFTNARVGFGQPLVLRPGEVQIVSQAYDKNATWIDGGKSNSFSDAKLGYEFGAGFKFKISECTDNNGAFRYPDLRNLPDETQISYGMTPTHKTAYNSVVLAGQEVRNSGGGFNLGSLGMGISAAGAKATDNPAMFPAIPNNSSFKTMEELAVTDPILKWPVCVYEIGFKPEKDSFYQSVPSGSVRPTGRFLQWNQPKAYAWDLIDIRPNSDYLKTIPLQVGIKRVNDHSDPIGAECDGAGLGYFGGGYGASEGVSYLVTHSVPRAPLHSLGALQHAIASLPAGATPSDKMQSLLPFVGHAISNSFAPSILAPSATTGTIGTGYSLRNVADHSYWLNQALWDDYFYSSVSPESASSYRNASAANAEQKERLRKFLGPDGTPSEPLPNSRFLPWASDPENVMAELFSGASPAADAHEKMAASLMIDGAFNVNSTSVAAWKSFLSSLKDSSVPVSDTEHPPATPVMQTASGTPVLAGLIASGNEIEEGDLSDPGAIEPWVGFRNLTDQQIDELAQAVVKQVRLRGPFLCLSDFVNRRPGTDKELAMSGALQSALDDDDVSINEAFRQFRSTGASETSGYAFPEAEQGAKAVGSAGYVKQADLLTPLAPFIAVRGDTFTIRAYGETRDDSDRVVARAWCEAIVQRLPEYIDPQDKATVASPSQPINQTYGRRFQVVSFRYLHPSEVL